MPKIKRNTFGGRRKTEKSQFDLGTDELRKRRLEALGPQREGWPEADMTAAESALGCLLWQASLHERYDQAKRMHDAGVMFASWWILVYPKCHAQGTLGQFQPKGPSSDIDTTEAEANLRSASLYLGKERAVLDAVINTCVYQRINYKRLDKLRTGLCRLMEWAKVQRRAA